MRAGGFPGNPGGLVVSIVKTAGARAPAHQARGRGRRTWRPTERTAGARMVPPGAGNEARGDGRRGVGVSHSTAEAGELSPRDPVEGRGIALCGHRRRSDDNTQHGAFCAPLRTALSGHRLTDWAETASAITTAPACSMDGVQRFSCASTPPARPTTRSTTNIDLMARASLPQCAASRACRTAVAVRRTSDPLVWRQAIKPKLERSAWSRK